MRDELLSLGYWFLFMLALIPPATFIALVGSSAYLGQQSPPASPPASLTARVMDGWHRGLGYRALWSLARESGAGRRWVGAWLDRFFHERGSTPGRVRWPPESFRYHRMAPLCLVFLAILLWGLAFPIAGFSSSVVLGIVALVLSVPAIVTLLIARTFWRRRVGVEPAGLVTPSGKVIAWTQVAGLRERKRDRVPKRILEVHLTNAAKALAGESHIPSIESRVFTIGRTLPEYRYVRQALLANVPEDRPRELLSPEWIEATDNPALTTKQRRQRIALAVFFLSICAIAAALSGYRALK